jgi:hypothetical protein
MSGSGARRATTVPGDFNGQNGWEVVPADKFVALTLTGHEGTMDNLSISTQIPADLSLDGDALPDLWELQHFGNLDQTGAGDADQDALTDWQEYQLGTDPLNADMDSDGMPDGWEYQHFGNATNAVTTDDPDGDGYLNVYEALHGGNPTNAASLPTPTRYVSLSGSHSSGFTNWACAATSIQAALDATAGPYEIVAVADGVYTGPGNRDMVFPAPPVILTSTGGAAACAIDCEQAGRAFYFFGGLDQRSALLGFTIRNGVADAGGGILCEGASPAIRDCKLTGNVADTGGGMALRQGASPRLRNCTLDSNAAGQDGGGLDADASSPFLENCAFVSNSIASHGGGALSCWAESSPLLVNCVIAGNTAPFGGGVYTYGIVPIGTGEFTKACAPLLRNCLLTGNTATDGGALIAAPGARPVMQNCTVAGNSAASSGGGVYAGGGTNTNCIVFGNTAATNANWRTYGSGMTFEHCCTTPTSGLLALDCIENDPAFIGNGDYRLSVGSPCTDIGVNQSWMDGAKDLDGNPRMVNGTVDIGAYEKQ